MAKTAYEVRLEVLKVAKELLTDDFFQKKEPLQNEYHEKVNRLTDGEAMPPLPTIPPFPTPADVISKAKELYKFITDDGKEADK